MENPSLQYFTVFPSLGYTYVVIHLGFFFLTFRVVATRNDPFSVRVRISRPAERSLFRLCKREARFDAVDESVACLSAATEERFTRGGDLNTTSSGGGGFSPENKSASSWWQTELVGRLVRCRPGLFTDTKLDHWCVSVCARLCNLFSREYTDAHRINMKLSCDT